MNTLISVKHRNCFVLASLLSIFSQLAQAEEERLVYHDKPMQLKLPVNVEVRVKFPQDVSLQVKEELLPKLKPLLPDAKTIYWTATEKFPASRIIATANNGSKVYVFDLIADTANPAKDLVIEDPSMVSASEQTPPVHGSTANATGADPAEATTDLPDLNTALTDPAEIVLTRFAAQTLYSPTRLLPSSDVIRQVSAPSIPPDFPLIQSRRGEQFSVKPVGAWSGYGKYITAVLIVNTTSLSLQFDATAVRGNFSHITAQHINIGPKNSLEDRTTLYLISDEPFGQAILGDSYAY